MRVLFWSELFWPYLGGVEIPADRFVGAMQACGHELAVITSHAELCESSLGEPGACATGLRWARWMLLPSPEYVRLIDEDHHSRAALRYGVERALRYARRRLRGRRRSRLPIRPDESGGVAASQSGAKP